MNIFLLIAHMLLLTPLTTHMIVLPKHTLSSTKHATKNIGFKVSWAWALWCVVKKIFFFFLFSSHMNMLLRSQLLKVLR